MEHGAYSVWNFWIVLKWLFLVWLGIMNAGGIRTRSFNDEMGLDELVFLFYEKVFMQMDPLSTVER